MMANDENDDDDNDDDDVDDDWTHWRVDWVSFVRDMITINTQYIK